MMGRGDHLYTVIGDWRSFGNSTVNSGCILYYVREVRIAFDILRGGVKPFS